MVGLINTSDIDRKHPHAMQAAMSASLVRHDDDCEAANCGMYELLLFQIDLGFGVRSAFWGSLWFPSCVLWFVVAVAVWAG